MSIRAGSNIHQTQTTPTIFANKGSGHAPGQTTASTTSVGWHKREFTVPKYISNLSENSDQTGSEHSRRSRTVGAAQLILEEKGNLVSLGEAIGLGLSSWDMVREHSSRPGYQASASTPLLPSDPDFLLPQSGGYSALFERDMSSEYIGRSTTGRPREHLSDQASKMALRNTLWGESAIGQVEIPTEKMSSSSPILREDTSPTPLDPVHSTSRVAKQIPSPQLPCRPSKLPVLRAANPRFTLEKQVESEYTKKLEHQTIENEGSALGGTREELYLAEKASKPSPRWLVTPRGQIASNSPDQNLPPTLPPIQFLLQPPHCSSDSETSHRAHPTQVAQIARYPPTSTTRKQDGAARRCQAEVRERKSSLESNRKTWIDNEAWMKFVFPDDHRNSHHPIQFEKSDVRHNLSGVHHQNNSPFDEPLQIPDSTSGFEIDTRSLFSTREPRASSQSMQTGANRSIFIPSPTRLTSTETNLLSHFSPMEGYLDERTIEVSIYNNAPTTEPSLFTPSVIEQQRYLDFGPRSETGGQRALVSAKRPAPYQLGNNTAKLRRSETLETAPRPQQSNLWRFQSNAKGEKEKLEPGAGRRPPADGTAQTSPLPYSIRAPETVQATVQMDLSRDSHYLESAENWRHSPPSIFVSISPPPADHSTFNLPRMNFSSIDVDASGHSFQPRSEALEASIVPSFRSSSEERQRLDFSARTAPCHNMTKSTRADMRTLPPLDFTRPSTPSHAQMPVWGGG